MSPLPNAARARARTGAVSNDNGAPSPLTADERGFLSAAAHLAFENPFVPGHREAERALLGDAFADEEPPGALGENRRRVAARLRPIIERFRGRLAAGAAVNDADLADYEDGCFSLLYETCERPLQALVDGRAPSDATAAAFRLVASEQARLLGLAALRGRVSPAPPEHVFACCFQMKRAVHELTSTLAGSSRPARELQASAWRSTFTDDLRGHVTARHEHLDDVHTLVTGPTGTGKELVAQSLGRSRYIAFETKTMAFVRALDEGYHALNLSALSPALIESELFGYHRGAFTGAVDDRQGWLDCAPGDVVFLDEIGELDLAVQVKLLRVLQTRMFQPVGSRASRRFSGRLVTATHRDLADRIRQGAFREDFFYRICSDWIVTPSLRCQLDDTPDDLSRLVRVIARRVTAPARAEALADKTMRWIGKNLPPDYPWPGNVRELEVCVRSIMIRGHYRPVAAQAKAPAATPRQPDTRFDPYREILDRTLPLDELVRRYATLVYAETSCLRETARRLGIDRHHVRSKIDEALLEQLWSGRAEAPAQRRRRARQRGATPCPASMRDTSSTAPRRS